jgi:hypothetical protein
MDCECGGFLVKTVQSNATDKLFFCTDCSKLWRLAHTDTINGNAVIVDYMAELKERNRENSSLEYCDVTR